MFGQSGGGVVPLSLLPTQHLWQVLGHSHWLLRAASTSEMKLYFEQAKSAYNTEVGVSYVE